MGFPELVFYAPSPALPPGGRKLVSGSLDRHLFLWDVDAPAKRVQAKDVHKGGVTGLCACGETSFASVGHDGFVLVHVAG